MADVATLEKKTHQTMEKARQAIEKVKHTDVKGTVNSAVEIHQKAATPLYLGLTAASIIISLILFGRKKREEAMFVGLWAPTFMGFGLLSKIANFKKQKFGIID